jgi:hypothetical protein
MKARWKPMNQHQNARRPPAFVEREAERLREPVRVAGEDAEQDARDDDVMEVGDEEQAVVHLPVDGRHREQDAGQAADTKVTMKPSSQSTGTVKRTRRRTS